MKNKHTSENADEGGIDDIQNKIHITGILLAWGNYEALQEISKATGMPITVVNKRQKQALKTLVEHGAKSHAK